MFQSLSLSVPKKDHCSIMTLSDVQRGGTLYILSKISFSDLILCPETCLGSVCSSDVSRSSLVFLKRVILTLISLRTKFSKFGDLDALTEADWDKVGMEAKFPWDVAD